MIKFNEFNIEHCYCVRGNGRKTKKKKNLVNTNNRYIQFTRYLVVIKKHHRLSMLLQGLKRTLVTHIHNTRKKGMHFTHIIIILYRIYY